MSIVNTHVNIIIIWLIKVKKELAILNNVKHISLKMPKLSMFWFFFEINEIGKSKTEPNQTKLDNFLRYFSNKDANFFYIIIIIINILMTKVNKILFQNRF